MRHRLTNLAFLAWLIAVFILSVFPNNTLLTQGPMSFDKHGYFQHLLAYSVGMVIGYHTTVLNSKWKIIVLILLWGITLEMVQYWLPYRSFNVFDILANISGILLGGMVTMLINKKIRIRLKTENFMNGYRI